VELLIGPSTTKKDPTTWKQMPKRTVTVTGPLGQLYLDIPPYLRIDHDGAAKRATLSVEDTTVKQQREMWGALRSHPPRETSCREVLTANKQERHGPTSTSTSSVYQKATRPCSGWLVLVTERQSKPDRTRRNIRVSHSSV
jgi:hypothetical protein